MRKPRFLRRSPFIVAYWAEGGLRFVNYLTGRTISASPLTAELLDFFSSWRAEADLLRRWRGYRPASLRSGVAELVREGFLQAASRRKPSPSPQEKALAAWRDWLPSAGHFHLGTKDAYSSRVTPDEIRTITALMRRHGAPNLRKSYRGAPTILLEKAASTSEFPVVLRARRTWREFTSKQVSQELLGRLLDLSFGVQAWERIPPFGRFAQKTSPSGGALHPIEAYVLARRVAGVAPGLYHYDAVGHRLQCFRRGATSAEIQRLLAGQTWFRGAGFVVFLAANFSRTQWKYNYARAYRAILIEAGHLCQTFCLTATWLGLAPFCTIAFADSQVEAALGLDGITESVVYAMGAGMPPAPKKNGGPPFRQNRRSTLAGSRTITSS